MLHSLTGWLGDLPLGSLYIAIGVLSAFAGAMRLPAFKVMLSVASASAVWFGLITFLAFRAGDNWDVVEHYLVRSGKVAGTIAIAIVVLAVGICLWKRQAKNRE